MVSSFLGPYYIVLALMNGLAALYLWRSEQTESWFELPIPFAGKRFGFTNVLMWLLFAVVFSVLAAIAGSGNTSLVSLPEWFREAVNKRPARLSTAWGRRLILVVLYVFRVSSCSRRWPG